MKKFNLGVSCTSTETLSSAEHMSTMKRHASFQEDYVPVSFGAVGGGGRGGGRVVVQQSSNSSRSSVRVVTDESGVETTRVEKEEQSCLATDFLCD
jgi:hypothetical protein